MDKLKKCKHIFSATLLGIIFLCLSQSVYAQSISGKITDTNLSPLKGVEVLLLPKGDLFYSDKNGEFQINDLQSGDYELVIWKENFEVIQEDVFVKNSETTELNFQLKTLAVELSELVVKGESEKVFRLRKLRAVEGTAIYAGKKTEVILLNQITGNTAANNARQIYSQIAGLNIYESNDAGLQLNIGGRGLDPNRTANFNTRQNGYDISADVLGYPESYYSPPAEALSEIQVIRGAASLQYGTQFGGLVNFKFKKPNPSRKIEWISRQSIGSNSLFTSFNSLSGTIKKLSYYTYFNYKQGNDFRPNSSFDSQNLFLNLNYQFSEKTSLSLEGTYLRYLAQQPGGLSDGQFYRDPTFSNRERNWFAVDWKMWAAKFEHRFNNQTDFSVQFFGLDAQREALGFRTNRVSQIDDVTIPRELLIGEFRNWGSEARLLHRYELWNRNAVFLIGSKFYKSNNKAIQGPGSRGSDADFSIQSEAFPNYPTQSNFDFPNLNLAIFGEHIFYLNDRFSITPGVRFDYIKTESIGEFLAIDFDLAGNPLGKEFFEDNRTFERNKVLLGVGLSYRFQSELEAYTNFSQNYRSVTFNDIRIVNPSFQVDPNISDESGFNVDFGLRGKYKRLNFDVSTFGLLYDNRLGEVLRAQTRINSEGEEVETGGTIRWRGNIGSAFIYGVESFIDYNIVAPDFKNPYRLNVFSNLAITNSNYFDSEIPGIEGKKVEFIPLVNLKTGIGGGYKNLLGSFQYTFISEQFTDASNAPQDRRDNFSGIIGAIPYYGVADFSMSYRYKFLKIESGINNLFDNSYFTRRATGYPGPGIIPSAPRTFYMTLEFKLGK